jgi:hypothetical protein
MNCRRSRSSYCAVNSGEKATSNEKVENELNNVFITDKHEMLKTTLIQ